MNGPAKNRTWVSSKSAMRLNHWTTGPCLDKIQKYLNMVFCNFNHEKRRYNNIFVVFNIRIIFY